MKKYNLLFLAIITFLITYNVSALEVKTGTYKIVSALDENKLLVEENGNIVLGNNESVGNTTWDVYSNGSYFYIRSHKDSKKALDLKGGKATNNQNIQLYTNNGSKAQTWKLNFSDNLYYFITSSINNYNIDVQSGANKVGANIQLYKNNGTKAQKWKFIRQDKTTNVIKDGTYIIKNTANKSLVLDLHGANTADRTNIQIYNNNFSWAQVWNIKYHNGYYTITSYLNNTKSIDIYNGKFIKGNNIWLYKQNGSNAQKFIIEEEKSGVYTIKTLDGLWALDIQGGTLKSGSNVWLYGSNGSKAQQFSFEKVNISPIETGYYTINSSLDENKVVGINNQVVFNGKNVELRTKNDHNYTKWYIKKVKHDLYTIANAENKNYVLDVKGGAITSGTNVQIYKNNGSLAQTWSIRKNDDNTYTLTGVGSSKVLDIYGGTKEEGTNIQIHNSNLSKAQKFTFQKTSVSPYTKFYNDGKYIIKSKLDTTKVLDVKGGNKTSKTNIQVYNLNSSKAQIWKLEYIGDGAYIIRSMINPVLVLSINGNNVISDKYSKSISQQWFIEKNGNNIRIINRSNGKFLNVDSDKPSNSTNVSLSDKSSTRTNFDVTSYNGTIKYKGVDLSAHNKITSWDSLSKEIDFAVIRAGFSDEVIQNNVDKYQDTKYLTNVENCEKYNIPYALYFYSYANKLNDTDSPSYNKTKGNSADSEAAHMISLFKKITNKGYYPKLSTAVFYDQEEKDQTYGKIRNYYKETDTSHPKTKELLTNMINRFCQKMNNNNHKCGVYSSSSWLTSNLNVKNIAAKHAIWVAQWPGYNTFDKGLANKSSYTTTEHKIWQFSDNGRLSGISGAVDLNIGYNIFD